MTQVLMAFCLYLKVKNLLQFSDQASQREKGGSQGCGPRSLHSFFSMSGKDSVPWARPSNATDIYRQEDTELSVAYLSCCAHSSVFPPIVKKTKKLGILRFKNPQVQLPSWEGNYKLILGILLDHVPAHCDFQKLMFCHTTVLLYRKEIGHFLVFLFPCSFPLGLREKK